MSALDDVVDYAYNNMADEDYVVAARAELARLRAEAAKLRHSLEMIAEMTGKCLLGNGRYDEGANAAFEQCAETARAVLAEMEKQ